MEQAVRFLAREITYQVPEQDLRIDRSRLPALPRSRFVIRGVAPGRGLAEGPAGGAATGGPP